MSYASRPSGREGEPVHAPLMGAERRSETGVGVGVGVQGPRPLYSNRPRPRPRPLPPFSASDVGQAAHHLQPPHTRVYSRPRPHEMADAERDETVWQGDDHAHAHSREHSNAHYGHSLPLPLPPPPPPPPPPDQTTKRANPLEDLIRTENLFVDDLGVIIKKVAGAYSRHNFPPPELDQAFRATEAVYRTNKLLVQKLNEIGPNPASPKALGDLLMRWIGDLEPAYTRYATNYRTGFDHFQPVQTNPKLGPILDVLSWPATLAPASDPSTPVTLDVLFSLPAERLVYYSKLYARLLKSTQEGRSDHALLVAANERLATLLGIVDESCQLSVLPEDQLRALALEDQQPRGETTGERSSGEGSDSQGSSDRNSTTTTGTSTGTPVSTPAKVMSGPPRIQDLERRLNTDRALDIFTMLPKKCKLSIAPPNLPFVRQLRRASDVGISFFPMSDPTRREVVLNRAYIILLTDLFLVCERMSDSERQADGQADMWLVYPPLAGKHLHVRDGANRGEIEVVVMRKEILTIRTESAVAAAEWTAAFRDAIEFGASQGLTIKTQFPSRSGSSTASAFSPSSQVPTGYSQGFSPLTLGLDVRGKESPPIASPLPLSPDIATPPPPPPREERAREWEQNRGDRPPRDVLPPTPPPMSRPPRKASMPGENDLPPPPPPPQLPRSTSLQQHLASLETGENGYGNNGYSEQDRNGYSEPVRRATEPPNQAYGAAQPQHTSFPFHVPPPQQQQSHISQQQGPYQQQQQQPYPPRQFQQSLPPSPNEFGYPSPTQSRSSPSSPYHSSDLQKSGSHASYGSDRTDRSSQYQYGDPPPPLPGKAYEPAYQNQSMPSSRRTDPGRGSGLLSPGSSIHRSRSADGLNSNHFRLPSLALGLDSRANSAPGSVEEYGDDSPPPSPRLPAGPTKTVIAAQMRCKAFLQQHHAQWKSLGTAKLKLFVTEPINTKQLVVESDKSDKKVFVSTIVLTNGVERVGKTGVAIELSDSGQRTGIIYMLQMKTEQAATGFFNELVKGSDRAARVSRGSKH